MMDALCALDLTCDLGAHGNGLIGTVPLTIQMWSLAPDRNG